MCFKCSTTHHHVTDSAKLPFFSYVLSLKLQGSLYKADMDTERMHLDPVKTAVLIKMETDSCFALTYDFEVNLLYDVDRTV